MTHTTLRGAGGTPGGLGGFFAGLAMILGGGILFFDGRSAWGWLLAAAGALFIAVGVVASLRVYFQPATLFDTLPMLGLIAGGLGVVARALRPSGPGAEEGEPAS